MKYALVSGVRSIASKGIQGVCQCCESAMIPKCGNQKINHWAHKSKKQCDSWHEPETQWHRDWKNNFDDDWQEFVFKDSTTNEKHIADVYTEHGLVIEFQHSYIRSEEKKSRENFYKRLVWIVDGTRLQRDFPRFKKSLIETLGSDAFNSIIKEGWHRVPKVFDNGLIWEMFPKSWLESSVPVIFDFMGNDKLKDDYHLRKNLYCLFPQNNPYTGIVATISRQAFIKSANNGEWSKRVNKFLIGLQSERGLSPKRQFNSLHKQYRRRRIFPSRRF